MKKAIIGVIGLGYVGLPLACLFALKYRVIGFDLNAKRVEGINQGADYTNEVPAEKVRMALESGLECTADKERLKECNIYIVAVPTPVDKYRNPDLSSLEKASMTVGEVISKGDIVVYESTVYPGVTEEFCVPVIEKTSGLVYNKDFFVGYSPERINPGDKVHTVENICKITSGSTPETAEYIDRLYGSVLKNGTYSAPSIKVAEAAKIIENSQRDVNIAFMNEIAKIFYALGIDTQEVLKAAETKWNFLPFKPGLVGGHCISVDPYYLIQRAELYGINPRLMVEARRINDTMGAYVANRVVENMNKNGIVVKNSSILILGFAFKENCPDIRNTKVADVYHNLRQYTSDIVIFDPWVDVQEVSNAYGIKVCTDEKEVKLHRYDAIVNCVSHSAFDNFDYHAMCKTNCVVYDVKGSVPEQFVSVRL